MSVCGVHRAAAVQSTLSISPAGPARSNPCLQYHAAVPMRPCARVVQPFSRTRSAARTAAGLHPVGCEIALGSPASPCTELEINTWLREDTEGAANFGRVLENLISPATDRSQARTCGSNQN